VLRVSLDTPLPRVAYYALDRDGHPRRLDRLADVRAALQANVLDERWSEATVARVQSDLKSAVEAEWSAMEQARSRLDRAQHSAQVARAVRLLLDAALVELALGQQPGLFDQEVYPGAFDEAAVTGLKRHGYPWAPLLRITREQLRAPRPTDPFYVRILNEPAIRLKVRFEGLRQQAERMVRELT
jgi:hypothetical protein